MKTIREAYDDLWILEGHIPSDERKEEYYLRSIELPALMIDGMLHFAWIFPGKGYDYRLYLTAVPGSIYHDSIL